MAKPNILVSCVSGIAAPHYYRKHWPYRQSLTPGMKNVVHKPLIMSSKVLPPPLHIKLGLMKNFVKISNFLFIFIVHKTMIVLLSRKQELTNEF